MTQEELKEYGSKSKYLALDIFGYVYNGKYPPDFKQYGNEYEGYKNNASEILFKDFATSIYDVSFNYHGKTYYLKNGYDHVALSDSHFTEEFQIFDNPNELIEKLEIEGKKLIDIIDELEDVDPR